MLFKASILFSSFLNFGVLMHDAVIMHNKTGKKAIFSIGIIVLKNKGEGTLPSPTTGNITRLFYDAEASLLET